MRRRRNQLGELAVLAPAVGLLLIGLHHHAVTAPATPSPRKEHSHPSFSPHPRVDARVHTDRGRRVHIDLEEARAQADDVAR